VAQAVEHALQAQSLEFKPQSLKKKKPKSLNVSIALHRNSYEPGQFVHNLLFIKKLKTRHYVRY
jgi:hypothetical protein